MGLLTNLLSTTTGQVVAACTVGAAVLLYFTDILSSKKDHLETTALIDGHSEATKPISVNYHFTRKCNKECGFCFHTEKTSYVASETDMKRGLKLLKDAGMKKINFAGGEPFLYPSVLGMLCEYCKVDLGLESVSIISNGTKVTEKWLQTYGKHVDVMGVSCDSFEEQTNIEIGRGTGKNVEQLFKIRGWCGKLGIKFKLNTVVCSFNWQEDMAATVEQLDPFRWKCFQVLEVQDENDAAEQETELDKRKRNAKRFVITNEQFAAFCVKHHHLDCFVPESNELMASSYLILDEYLCFLDKGAGKEKQSSSILKVGVAKALEEVTWDKEAFISRGGVYDWSKELDGGNSCGKGIAKNLQWRVGGSRIGAIAPSCRHSLVSSIARCVNSCRIGGSVTWSQANRSSHWYPILSGPH